MTDKDALIAKIEEYKVALTQDPKSTVFVRLSAALVQLGQLEDALEVALKGTWEAPQFALGYVAVGRVYAQRNVYTKAEEALYRALSVDQTCIPAYKGLAKIYKDQEDIQKASDILTKAIMLEPGDTSLQQMIESLPVPIDNSATGSDFAGIDSGTGVTEPVVNEELAMDQTSDGMKPITTATIADIYIEQGLYDKALQVYRELLSENSQDVAVQQKISELEALMNSAGAQMPYSADTIQPVSAAVSEPLNTSVISTGSDIVIGKLNGWLEAIQARRNRV